MYHSVQTRKKKLGRRKIIVNKSLANFQRFAKCKATRKKKKTKKCKQNLPLLAIPDETAAVGESDVRTEQLTLGKCTRSSGQKLNDTKSNVSLKKKTGSAEGSSALNSSSLSHRKQFPDKYLRNYKSSDVFVIELEDKTATESIQDLDLQESCSAPTEMKLNQRRSFVPEETQGSPAESNKRVIKRKKCTHLESTPSFKKQTRGLKKKKSLKPKNKRSETFIAAVAASNDNSIGEMNTAVSDNSLPFSEYSFSLTEDETGEKSTDFESTWEKETSDKESTPKEGFADTFEESDDPKRGTSEQLENTVLNGDDYNDTFESSDFENYGRRKLYIVNQNLVLLLEHPNEIAVRGCTTLQVLFGCIEISGLVLGEDSVPQPIISPASQSASTIKTEKATRRAKTYFELIQELVRLQLDLCDINEIENFLKNECTILLFQEHKHPVSRCLSSYIPTLFQHQEKIVLSCHVPWCSFVNPQERTVVKIPQDWYDIADVFCQLAENYKASNEETDVALGTAQAFASVKNHSNNKLVRNLRILICGGKNCGKSTFLRFLVNSLLNVTNDVVYYLDADPGQSEFTIPGCVSIAEIKEPLLGPSFSHQKKLIKSHFVGGVSVHSVPDLYSKSIKSLADFINSEPCFSGKPLLINTMGWISGMGRALLLDAVRFLQPMFIIQINQLERANYRKTEYFTTEFLERQPGWLTNIEEPVSELDLLVLENVLRFKRFQFTAAELRNIAIIAYFAQLYKSCDISKPIHGFTPYRVPWSSVGVYVCHEYVPNHKILFSLNCSIVALCVCDPSLLKTSGDSSLPKFLLSFPVCDCVGFGIIRGINFEQKEFYVITPVKQEDLKNVNLFLKGSLNIPEQMILNQKNEGGLPYVTEVPSEQTIVGGRTTKKRKLYNVKSALD